MELSLKKLNLINDNSLEWNFWYLLVLVHIISGCILSYLKNDNDAVDNAAASNSSAVMLANSTKSALSDSIAWSSRRETTESECTVEIASVTKV